LKIWLHTVQEDNCYKTYHSQEKPRAHEKIEGFLSLLLVPKNTMKLSEP